MQVVCDILHSPGIFKKWGIWIMNAPLSLNELNCNILMENVPFDIHFNGLHIRIVRYTKIHNNNRQWIIPFHAHESYEFHYISSGEGYIDIENSGFIVKKGDFYITVPYVRHRQSSSTDNIMEEYCVECKIDLRDSQPYDKTERDITEEEIRQLKIFSGNSMYTHFTYTEDMMNNLSQIGELLAENTFGSLLKTQALLTLTLLDSLRIAHSLYQANKQNVMLNSENSRIIRIKNYLDGNLCTPITIQDVAKVFYLSPRQLDRILIREYGMSFNKYLMNLRMNMAIRLLERGEDTVSNIAVDSGFSSYQQMYRVLKRNKYSSPRDLSKEL